jgi:hypothetical protein
MPKLIWTHTACNCINLVSVQVLRVVSIAATATCIFGFRLGLSLGYGLDFLLGTLALESDTLPRLAIRHRVCFRNYSLSRLSARGWLQPMVG